MFMDVNYGSKLSEDEKKKKFPRISVMACIATQTFETYFSFLLTLKASEGQNYSVNLNWHCSKFPDTSYLFRIQRAVLAPSAKS